MQARIHLKKGAALTWTSQFDSAIDQLSLALSFTDIFTSSELDCINQDLETILLRKLSQMVKARGDHHFSKKDFEKAMVEYEQALVIDPHNEYAISNIGLIYLKNNDFENCFNWTNRALKVLEMFYPASTPYQKDHKLEVKLLQRRSKCFE